MCVLVESATTEHALFGLSGTCVALPGTVYSNQHKIEPSQVCCIERSDHAKNAFPRWERALLNGDLAPFVQNATVGHVERIVDELLDGRIMR